MNIKINLGLCSFFVLALNIAPVSAQTTNLHPLHNELVASHDYKKFFDKVKGQPQSGGLFYASLVMGRCLKVQNISANDADGTKVSADILARRKVAIGKLNHLCSGFKKSELSDEKLGSLFQSPSASNDPFLAPMKRAMLDADNQTNNVSLEDHRSMLSKLFAENSPEAYLETSPFVPIAGKGHYFDGKYYQSYPPHDGLIFDSAMLLTACDLGDKCDANDFRLLYACADKAICVDSRFEYVQSVFKLFPDMTSPDDVGTVVSLSNKLTQAIKNHDVNLFIPSSTQ